jgi:hypothetical protein
VTKPEEIEQLTDLAFGIIKRALESPNEGTRLSAAIQLTQMIVLTSTLEKKNINDTLATLVKPVVSKH